MNTNVFREYDIRGHAARDFPNDFVAQLGTAFAAFQTKKGFRTVALGRDCRHSSPRIHRVLRKSLIENGMDVVDIGMVPTPLTYFAVHHLGIESCIQITGSHNPKDENGFKMMTGKGSLYGDDIRWLRDHMEKGLDLETQREGSLHEIDLCDRYAGFIKGSISLGEHVPRFAVDAGNGAAGPLFLKACDTLNLPCDALYCDPDGDFPNHHPDPTDPDSLQDVVSHIQKEELDFGVAFDGDGDRLGVVTRDGQIVWGDKLMVLFSEDLLRRHPGAPILADVKCSNTLFDAIKEMSGQPIMWKTGHSLIKSKMKDSEAVLAGEMSGHLFFADRYYGFDDALYAALRLVELLSNTEKSLEEKLETIPLMHATPEIRVPCSDDQKFDIVERVRAHFSKTHEVNDVDGARVRFDHGWGLVRASNTQPVIVTRYEADSEEMLASIQTEIELVLKRAGA